MTEKELKRKQETWVSIIKAKIALGRITESYRLTVAYVRRCREMGLDIPKEQ